MSDKFSNFKKLCVSRIKKNIAVSLKKKCSNPGLYAPMKYVALSGGKFLRALLVYTVGKTLKINLPLLDQPATAIELIHTYTLIHDDLPSMDNDNLRRGKPTVHKKFNEFTAILAGNSLLTSAFEILSSKDLEILQKYKNELIKTLSICSGHSGLAGGQYFDLSFEKKNNFKKKYY